MVTMLHTNGTTQPFYFLRFLLVWCAIFHPFYFQPVFARMFRCVCIKSINLDYEVILKIQPVSLWPINYLCVCVCVSLSLEPDIISLAEMFAECEIDPHG